MSFKDIRDLPRQATTSFIDRVDAHYNDSETDARWLEKAAEVALFDQDNERALAFATLAVSANLRDIESNQRY